MDTSSRRSTPVPPPKSPAAARHSQRKVARVLLALGGERSAARALIDADAFARALGAELHVVRVVSNVGRAAPEEPLSIARAIRESQCAVAAGRHTRGLCDRILLERLPSRSICVRLGAFVSQVAQRAAELDADIIAIVPHRRQLGAVATHLALETGCGVLVARGRGSFATLLAATDLEDDQTPVLRRAARLGQELDAAVVALHGVVDEPSSSGCSVALERRREALERAALAIGSSIRPLVLRAKDSAQCILDGAKTNSADIIIVGTRARSAAGATAAHVVRRARRSVLVAPIGGGTGPSRALLPS